MSIILSPATQARLKERLKCGDFQSADDLIEAALTALDYFGPSELDEEALDATDRAEDQIDRGEVHEWMEVRERLFTASNDDAAT